MAAKRKNGRHQVGTPDPQPINCFPPIFGSISSSFISNLYSEADERVQRFYGILPKEVKGEVKTPRMVKQASKKNSKVRRSGSGEEDSESLEVSHTTTHSLVSTFIK